MDATPEESSGHIPTDHYVTLSGVRFHYLDWGGHGEPLIFLAGLRFTAHIFIELAPAFSDRFRVLALTRRGHGLSDATAEGNDILTAANDLHQFLAALHLDRINLVGHSMGGGEISAFAERYPRQAKVVEMRYFADLEHEEVAECLGVSAITVKRDWQFARIWLRAHLEDGAGDDGKEAAARRPPRVLA